MRRTSISGIIVERSSDRRTKTRRDVFLEVEIYDVGEPAHARALYRDPKVAQTRHRVLKDVGAEARVDESRVLDYGVEFRKGRFFVRVAVFEKGEVALNAAVVFSGISSTKLLQEIRYFLRGTRREVWGVGIIPDRAGHRRR